MEAMAAMGLEDMSRHFLPQKKMVEGQKVMVHAPRRTGGAFPF